MCYSFLDFKCEPNCFHFSFSGLTFFTFTAKPDKKLCSYHFYNTFHSWSADKVENCSNSVPKLTEIHEQTRRRTFLKVYPNPTGIRLRAGDD